MAKVYRWPGESIENMIARFKSKCWRDGVFRDTAEHSRYVKPSEKARRKSAAARKRDKRASRSR